MTSKEQAFSFSALDTLNLYHIFRDSEDFNEGFHLFSVENDFKFSFILGLAVHNHFSVPKCLLIHFPRHQFEVLPFHLSWCINGIFVLLILGLFPTLKQISTNGIFDSSLLRVPFEIPFQFMMFCILTALITM